MPLPETPLNFELSGKIKEDRNPKRPEPFLVDDGFVERCGFLLDEFATDKKVVLEVAPTPNRQIQKLVDESFFTKQLNAIKKLLP